MERLVDTNLAVLESIPNSVEYWADLKKELFVMITQLCTTITFVRISANETQWSGLLHIWLHVKTCDSISSTTHSFFQLHLFVVKFFGKCFIFGFYFLPVNKFTQSSKKWYSRVNRIKKRLDTNNRYIPHITMRGLKKYRYHKRKRCEQRVS